MSAEQQSSSKLAKIITELTLERDAAKRQATAPLLLKLSEMSKPKLHAFWREQHRQVEAKLAAGEDSTEKWRQVGSLLREMAAVGSDASPFTAGTTTTATSVPTSLAMPANLPTTSLGSFHSKAPAPAKKQDGAPPGTNYSKPSVLGHSTKAVDLVIKEPLDDSTTTQLAIQDTVIKSMPACRLIPYSVVPSETKACSKPNALGASMHGAKENVHPAANDFSFGVRQITSPDTGRSIFAPKRYSSAEAVQACSTPITVKASMYGAKANAEPVTGFTFSSRCCTCLDNGSSIFAPNSYSPAEAVTSPAEGQCLSTTTGSEVYSHVKSRVSIRITDPGKPGHAQDLDLISRTPLTAPEAHHIHMGSITGPATAAKAVSSAASNDLISSIATEAGNIGTTQSCASSAVKSSHCTTAHLASTTDDCGNGRMPTMVNPQMKGSIAATR